MVRASLPAVGVAAALLWASTAVGQMPQFSADPPVRYLTPLGSQTDWQPVAAWHHPLLDMMGEIQLTSLELALDDEAPRLSPTPKETKEPKEAGAACPGEVFEEVDCFSPCYVPVPYYLPSPYQGGCGHKGCHRRQKHGCGHGGCQGGGYPGGYAAGYGGFPYGGWGMGGCGMGGCGMGGCGMGGCGFYPPPPPPQQGCSSGRRCHRNQGGFHFHCPRCGYGYGGYTDPSAAWGGPGWGGGSGAGYPGGWAYPVAGWSTMNDGYNGFTDPNCFGGGKQGCCHGLFHRKCHSCHNQQQGPPPYPYGPAPQPFCMDGCCPF